MRYVNKWMGVVLSLPIAMYACGWHAMQSVPLPPLDMPLDSAALGEPGTYRIQPGDLLQIGRAHV